MLEITTDKSHLDLDFVYNYLHYHAYWCRGIPRATIEKSIKNSMCFIPLLEKKANWICTGYQRLCHLCIYRRCVH